MGGSLFWGIVMIIIGASLIIKVVFNIEFPIVKILAAFFFIYLGIKILMGNFGFHFIKTGSTDIAFGEKTFKYEQDIPLPKEQNIIFGKGIIDLRNVVVSEKISEIEINTVFGSSEILILKSTPVKVKIDAAFAGASLPNNNTIAFGSSTYQSPSYDESKPYLKIKADAVFGSLRIIAY